MRRWLVVAFVSGIALGALVVGNLIPEAQAGVSHTWEYNCTAPPRAKEKGKHPSMDVINHLGKQGWELVTVDPSNGHFCFKRAL